MLLFMLLAIALRLPGLWSSAIWYDEAYSLALARLPLAETMHLQALDFNPPLWELLIKPLAATGSIYPIRLLSLICSLGTVALAWKICERLHFTYLQRWISMAIIVMMPGLIWSAQDGRMYALYSLLFLAAAWYALDDRWLGLFATCGLMIFLHATAPALVLTILSVVYLRGNRQAAVMVGIGCAVVWASWAPFTLVQHVHQFWLAPWIPLDLINGLASAMFAWTWPGVWLLGIWVLIAITLIYVICKPSLPGLLFAVPLAIITIVSVMLVNVTLYRPLTPLLAPFSLWLGPVLAGVFTPMNTPAAGAIVKRGALFILAISWAVTLIGGALMFDPSRKGGRIDDAAALIRADWREGDVILYPTGTVALPFDYYLHDLPHVLAPIDQHPATGNAEILRTLGFVTADPRSTARRIWLVWPRDDDLMGPVTVAWLHSLADGGQLIGTWSAPQFAPIEVYLIPR